ncbi:MAG: hypothetical protein MPN21_06110 [Thermoanaerobaculia bacterium]|nr:hypothetical protein [Thermoanaerobaculia bacterium]
MIRKLNTPTAILLVACLTLAPAAFAADGSSGSWISNLVEIVKSWVGGDEEASEAPARQKKPTPTMATNCSPGGGELGPGIEPNGPGC